MLLLRRNGKIRKPIAGQHNLRDASGDSIFIASVPLAYAVFESLYDTVNFVPLCGKRGTPSFVQKCITIEANGIAPKRNCREIAFRQIGERLKGAKRMNFEIERPVFEYTFQRHALISLPPFPSSANTTSRGSEWKRKRPKECPSGRCCSGLRSPALFLFYAAFFSFPGTTPICLISSVRS